jgi:hypothetical protein
MKTCSRFVAMAAPWVLLAALARPASAQTQLDPAAANAMVGMRPLIGLMRDTLESNARTMAAADQPMDIEKMFDQIDGGTPRSGRAKPPPVDPTIRTLDCTALAARLTHIDAAIEAKFVELEASEKVVDAGIKRANAAAGAQMATTSQMCTYGGPAGCLAAAAMSRAANPGMNASAMRNAGAVNDLDRLRSGFDPLLRERTTAVYHAQRKACK